MEHVQEASSLVSAMPILVMESWAPLSGVRTEDREVGTMRAAVARRFRSDDGLTMIEIVISAVIFFVVLTAILGLLGTTTQMSTAAKQRAVMTNAINAYVERVSAMPFEDVALVENGGELSAEETQTVGEFVIVIRPAVSIPTTMTSSETPTLKRLRLTVSVTRGASGSPISYVTEVLIRDRDRFLTSAVSSPETDPRISFTDSTPAEGSVVWESNHSGGALTVGATAQAAEGRAVSSVALWCDDQFLLKDTLGNVASWTSVDAQTFTTPSFIWDTRQTNELGEYVIVDGYRTLSAYVLDSGGVSKYTVRHFLVDNHAPAVPTTASAVPVTATKSQVSWAEVMDGTTPADHYMVYFYKQAATSDTWALDSQLNTFKGLSAEVTTTPFSRYRLQMQAHSPRNNMSDWYVHPISWISRPALSGTSTTSGSNRTVNLTCSTPQFPYSSFTYSVYRGTTSTNLTWHQTLPVNMNTFTESFKKTDDYY
ncbi:MAG: hypothetical protein ABFC80_05675, partial [Coriobacteriales bacterium]